MKSARVSSGERHIELVNPRMTALRNLLSVMRRAWPVSLVCVLLLLGLAAPGLLASQAQEAIVDYLQSNDGRSVIFSRLGLTIMIATVFGASLPAWIRLTARAIPGSRLLARIAYPIPLIAIAFATTPLYAGLGDYGIIEFLAVTAIIAAATFPVGRWLLRAVGQRRGEQAGRTRKILASWLPPRPRLYDIFFVISARAKRFWMLFAFVVMVAGTIIFGATDQLSIDTARALGPINLFLVAMFVLVAGLSMLLVVGRRVGFPVIPALLVLALTFSYLNLNDNHPVRGRYVSLVTGVNNQRINPSAADRPYVGAFGARYAEWRTNRPDALANKPYPVIMVSTEGGGIRAAFFTAIILARLVDHCPSIASHIFAISGVSGGAVGATVFSAALTADPPDIKNPRCSMHTPTPPHYENRVAAVLQDDHLSPLLARFIFPDSVQRFLPFPVDRFDRQIGLERGLELSFKKVFGRDTMTQPAYAIRWSDENPAVPYLLLNTTQVETGQRIVIAPFLFMNEDFDKLLSLNDVDVGFVPTASAAAGMSARFPFLSPAGYIGDGKQKHRFVDGGYVDNSGAETTIEMLRSLVSSQGGTDRPNPANPDIYILLHIGNAPECDVAKLNPAKVSPAVFARCVRLGQPSPATGLSELMSPIRALLNARDARNELNLRRWEREITSLQDAGKEHWSHRVQMYDRGIPEPLGWLLSHRATDELRSQLGIGAEHDGDCTIQINVENGCELDSLLSEFISHR